jgi:single stranded DNA-binding protein
LEPLGLIFLKLVLQLTSLLFLKQFKTKEMNLNNTMIGGSLGSDPELKVVGNDKKVCNLSVATSESYRTKDCERGERTVWHKVVLWGGKAEWAGASLKKGESVFIEGRLQYESWVDDNEINRDKLVIAAQAIQVVMPKAVPKEKFFTTEDFPF